MSHAQTTPPCLITRSRKLLEHVGHKGLKVQITGTGLQAHNPVLKAASKHHH
ncbi:MAG TPA: hypothetical protein VGX26_08605 [Solirubrobacteraceae bacterium]|jgi:hypothetical protein|nr:hypothetical protein [Solirubrobacteraceae bacterium]